MPIKTDLSTAPHFDDYNENKDYYRILFQPGVAPQIRELNQLQTILQKQIEKLGDVVVKRGTIIEGCDITFHDSYPYVKINDTSTDGTAVNVGQYIGYFVRNEANISPLIGAVQTVVSGFESRNPDLNTLYVRYINSGYANVGGTETEQTQFAANQILTVYNPEQIIEKVNIFNESSGFSNTDSVIFTSAIAVQNSSGGTTFANSIYVNDHINDGTANVQVVEIDTTTNTEVVILRIKPRAVDLKAGNSALWTISVNSSIQTTNAAPSDVVNVVDVIGDGATAILRTGSAGEIDTISMTNNGSDYSVLPVVSISSTGATTSQIAQANIIAQNYLTRVTVGNTAVDPVGNGYAISVGKGWIYQKGYMLRVDEHLTIVEKYANTPDLVAVGFDTTESIITSNQDPSLLDNATGEPNETAPGANRLNLTPALVVKTKAAADSNTDFLSIVEFSGGSPYKQHRQTVFNIIGNEMERRTSEESGDYVLDQFLLNTKAANTLADEANSLVVVIDPGVAYIRGKRVETVTNYQSSVRKGTDTFIANNVSVSMNYGNYIRVNEFSGVFDFSIGDQVDLYDAAQTYLTGGDFGTVPAPSGNQIGVARIRSLVHESGIQGTPTAVYRLYLFDIRMNSTKNFADTRAVFYDGTVKGIADTIIEGGKTVLKDTNLASLLMYAGREAVKTGNNFSYVYRTVNDSGDIKLATNGIITFAASGNETFPYTASATLSTAQEKDIIVIPLANAEFAANSSGSITCNTTSPQVNGTSTAFTSELEAGDYIKLANSTVSIIAQVSSIANDTVLTLTANAADNFTTGNVVVYLPAFAPISLERASRSANVDSNANTLTIDLGAAVNAETDIAVSYSVRTSNTTPVVKTVNRDHYIRIDMSNNAGSNTGPWCLGIPDVFRMKSVTIGGNNTFADTDGGIEDITNDFYIDHNQTEDYYGLSYLYLKPTSSLALSTANSLLVKLDHFTDSGEGLKAPGAGGTYAINDTVALANADSSINTLEIPEVYGVDGTYYDLRDHFDFRPQSANTIAANSTPANAPINPVEPTDSGRFTASDKKFPAPDTILTGVLEYYQGRTDRVVVDDQGNFNIIPGVPESNSPPPAPTNALTINTLHIPPYPSHPYSLSAQTVIYADKGIANEKYTDRRFKQYRVTTPIGTGARKILQPRGYTMKDIGTLENRIHALEYYVALNLAETGAAKRIIPSSGNTAIDRFKFGFYVDNFSDYSLADTQNPGYNAAIVDGRLTAKFDEINLPAEPVTGNNASLPYIERELICQAGATDGPLNANSKPGSANSSTGSVVVTPVNNKSANTTTSQSIATITQKNKTLSFNNNGSVYEEFFYTMSNASGPVTLFVSAISNHVAAEIFQSTSQGGPWSSIKTSADATAITLSDKNTHKLDDLNDRTFIAHPSSLHRAAFGPVGFFINDQFKLTLTYNPNGGRYFKIRIYKGSAVDQRFTGKFEYKLLYPLDSVVNEESSVTGLSKTTNYNVNYNGSIPVGTTGQSGISSMSLKFRPITLNTGSAYNAATSQEQAFEVVATGLRPNTQHRLFIEGVDVTNKARQEGSLIGSGLKSDRDGIIEFIFYYYPDIEPVSAVSTYAARLSQASGTKSVVLQSSDGQSKITSTIAVKQYIKDDTNSNAYTTSPLNQGQAEDTAASRLFNYLSFNDKYQ